MNRNNHTLGDGPIQPELVMLMNGLARGIDEILNGHSGKKRNGFVVMVFPFDDHKGRSNSISNARREDIVVLLREQLARFEGQPEMEGHA